MPSVPPRDTAIIYLRQSMDRSGEELAVSRQREDGEALAAARGLTVAAVHADNDTSASGRKPRPGFDAALADIRAGKAGVLIAWNLDRLTRNARDRLRFIETGRDAGTLLLLVRGSDIDMSTPAGRLTADILASVAQHEIEQKADRQRRANIQAAQAGRRVGGRRPFGYEQDGRTLRPDEAAAVEKAYQDFLTGKSLAAIARDWNAAGFTAQRRPWDHGSVRMVLANPRYMGQRAYMPRERERSDRRRAEITAQANWPALTDEDTWHAVRDILEDRVTGKPRGGPKLLLTGVALCGVCKATVHAGSSRHGYQAYICARTGAHISRRAEPVDEWAEAHAVERLSRPDAADLLAPPKRPGTAALRMRRQALLTRLDGLAAKWVAEELTDGQLRAMTAGLKEKIAEIETQMASTARAAVLGPVVGAGDTEAAWQALTVDHRRTIIDLLMTVTLLPAGKGVRRFRPESVLIEPRSPQA